MGKLIPPLEVKGKSKVLVVGIIDLRRDLQYSSAGKPVQLNERRQGVLVPAEYSSRMGEIRAELKSEGEAYHLPDSHQGPIEVPAGHFATHYFPDPNRPVFHIGLPGRNRMGLELILCQPIVLVKAE
ncbi:MAG TPA: hypothetical protein HA362_03415 [Nanoarchaeota archaeon]|nr:hypothetical protein [Nanoarchaeota archaeon]